MGRERWQLPRAATRPVSVDSSVSRGGSVDRVARRSFRILFGCLVCVGMGHSIAFSVFPPLARELGISEFQAGTVFSVSALLWVLTSTAWGRRSDDWGRRPVILIGLVGYAVSTLAFAVAAHAGLAAFLSVAVVYPLLIGSRAIFGAIGSGIFPAAQAYIVDRTSPEQRIAGVATISAALGLGTAAGPALGVALVAFGLVAPLYAVGVIAAISAVVIWRWLPEHRPPVQLRASARMSPWDARVRPFILIGLAQSTVQAILMQTIGFYYMDSLTLDPRRAAAVAGIGLSAFALATLAAQLALMRSGRLGAATLLVLGGAVGLGACGLLIAPASFVSLTAGMAFAGLAMGMLRPGNAAAISLSVGPDHQGAAAGLLGATAAAGWVMAPVLGAGLYQIWPVGPYVLSAFLLASIGLLARIHPGVRNLR